MGADSVDVLVVGGGLIGASAALGIAASGRRLALADRRRPSVQPGRLGADLRTVALSPASQTLLRELGAWEDLPAAPCRSMRVWEERGGAEIRFHAQEVEREELGWIVEVGPAVAALWRRLEACANAECLVESLTEMRPTEEKVAAQVGERRIQARLAVAADGGQSAVRSQLGVQVKAWETGQVALVTLARAEQPHRGTAYQRFLLDGPLALLPCVDARTVSVIWSQSSVSGQRRLALDDAAFCGELTQASEACLGAIQEVDRRQTFRLTQSAAAALNPRQRVLLIGDAARVLHPMAGLGVNLGFEDIAGLLQGLAHPQAEDPGAPGLWRAFARRRKARSLSMTQFLAGLRAFYAMPQPAANWLRNLGVHWVDGFGPLKRQIIREALGQAPIAQQLR